MASIKFVSVVFAVLNGQCILGYQNDADKEILSAEASAVLKAAVGEISTKYDTVIHEIQAVVAGQQKHIEDLQNDKAILQEAFGALKSEVVQYELRLKELTNAVIEQGEHIKTLEASNKKKSDSIEQLGNILRDESNQIPCMKEASKTNSTSKKQEEETFDTKDHYQGRVRRAGVETEVAFFAYISSNDVNAHLGVNQDIVFDNVDINIGSGYLPHHGTFLAPVDGIYVFSASVHALVSSRAHLVADGNVVARFFADNDEPTHVSQTIVVSLRKGADVSVQNINSNHSYYGGRYSTFTGFLLYENYINTPIVG